MQTIYRIIESGYDYPYAVATFVTRDEAVATISISPLEDGHRLPRVRRVEAQEVPDQWRSV